MSAPQAPAAATARDRKDERDRVWTVLDLLRWTTDHFASRGIESARLDAELLLAHALGVDRLRLYVDYDKPVTEPERAGFRELVRARAGRRVPVSQLLGTKEFWSLSLQVTADVLTPRPDTETLVSAALDRLPDRSAELEVLDLGTGSGAVALALASELPRARLTATDLSPAALAVAGENARSLGVADRLELLEGDLFAPVAGRRFDLVVSNPPYLAESERSGLAPELGHEPDLALFAAEDGLAVLRRLAEGVAAALRPGGVAAFELAPDQAPRVADWCLAAGLLDVTVCRDLGRRPRVVAGTAPASDSPPQIDSPPQTSPPERTS